MNNKIIFDKYCINDKGELYNIKTNRKLKLRPSNKGYLKTNISIDGKLKTVFIHRLVAEAFIDNPNNLPQVNHKDENKQNNCVENLEWCDAKYNMNYGTINERRAKSSFRKKVNMYDLNNNLIKEFNSITEASKYLNVNSGMICKVCNRKNKKYKNYIFTLV